MSNASVNLIGRLTADPDYKEGKEKEYCTFHLAVNQNYNGQNSASFFNCIAYGTMANRIRKAGVSKGSLVHISGALTLREYTDKEGAQRLSADVSLYDWDYVNSKPKSDEQNDETGESPKAGKTHQEKSIDSEDDLPI